MTIESLVLDLDYGNLLKNNILYFIENKEHPL